MSRRSMSAPDIFEQDLPRLEVSSSAPTGSSLTDDDNSSNKKKNKKSKDKRGSGGTVSLPGKFYSFITSADDSKERRKRAEEVRAVPGRRLARGKTHFLPTDELDDERHEEITAYLADDDGDQPSSSKGSLDNTLPGENISGMQRKHSISMYDAISALEHVDLDIEGELGREDDEDNVKSEEEHKLIDRRDSGNVEGASTIIKADDAPSKGSFSSSSMPALLTHRSSGNIKVRKSAGELELPDGVIKPPQQRSKINLDSNSINVCREQSTVRIGNSVLFPLSQVPPCSKTLRFDFACTDFKTWKHFTDGSNSHIYKARCAPTAAVPPESRSDAIADNTQAMLKSGAKVIIKALKDAELQNSVALREFDSERELLASISHPNILRFLGSGIDITNSIKSDGLGPPAPTRTNSMKNMLEGRSKIYPKPFLVLERLNGGSLSLLLSLQQGTPFDFVRALEMAHQLASALHYLHNEFHSEAVLIHRDIKPDNVGFDDKGNLKLMDFGISTCVRRKVLDSGPYRMTGCTGSLRYMAKEVFLGRAYNQSVDVYSFGILLWQLLTVSTPFFKFTRQQFSDEVVGKDLRPSLDVVRKSCSSPQVESLLSLMSRCWAPNYSDRPDMREVEETMRNMLEEERPLHMASAGCCA